MSDLSSKTSHGKLYILGLTALMIVCALSFLILTPKAVKLAETTITRSININGKLPPVVADVVGEERKPTIQIVDAKISPPVLHSAAVIALDFDTDQILYAKNINTRLAPASTTKIMTSLVAEDFYQSADILTVPAEAMVGGSTMGLNVGERATYRSLLYGMLLNSGNDAAYTLAIDSPVGLKGFVEKMNQKVTAFGLRDTHFDNPAGFDSLTHYSSAYDLALIAKEAVLDPQLSKVVATKNESIVSFDGSKSHNLQNLNKLLAVEGVIGIKTGTTEKAGESFVGLIERNGHKILTVVLNSPDRFAETKTLVDWVYQNYSWQEKTD